MTSHAWFYSTGFLGAPGWLKRAVSKLTGVDYDSVVYRRIPGAAAGTGAKRRASASASTAGARNSTRGSGSPAGGFKGEGRRLGSVKME
jgi:Derlin-2/3